MNDKDLQALLKRWQLWSKNNIELLGHSSITVEYRLMNSGHVIKSTGNTIVDDPECELLDRAIASMPFNFKKIIKLKYLYNWINRDAAKTLNMSMCTYKESIVRSRIWLSAYLTK